VIEMGLTNKRVVVSGAGNIKERAGHGRPATLQLARAGARLACIDLDSGRAESAAAEARSQGVEAYPIVADMTDRQQVARSIGEAVQALGGIDVCVDIIGGAVLDGHVPSELTHLESFPGR
jgi:NAD(P)-dependent dehydrogenase (short-subunit alcohol dehydrogenase family)